MFLLSLLVQKLSRNGPRWSQDHPKPSGKSRYVLLYICYMFVYTCLYYYCLLNCLLYNMVSPHASRYTCLHASSRQRFAEQGRACAAMQLLEAMQLWGPGPGARVGPSSCMAASSCMAGMQAYVCGCVWCIQAVFGRYRAGFGPDRAVCLVHAGVSGLC